MDVEDGERVVAIEAFRDDEPEGSESVPPTSNEAAPEGATPSDANGAPDVTPNEKPETPEN